MWYHSLLHFADGFRDGLAQAGTYTRFGFSHGMDASKRIKVFVIAKRYVAIIDVG